MRQETGRKNQEKWVFTPCSGDEMATLAAGE